MHLLLINIQKKISILHVYFENGIVKNATTDKYDIFTNEKIVPKDKVSNIDYKLQFFKGHGAYLKVNLI